MTRQDSPENTDVSVSPDMQVEAGTVVLRLNQITKSFPGVKALSDVSLEVVAGEVHALVGENGAGKSTLMAVASGALAQDEGTVEIGGQLLREASPDQAREFGLAIVRQDPALLPDLTVAENMAIGRGDTSRSGLRNAVSWAQEHVDPWLMGIDARDRVATLSVEQRFVVEIAKALALKPRVLILDEPTEHLNNEEVQRLFSRVREVAAANAAVIYISHRIPEVRLISDRVSVLRDGGVRGTFEAKDVSESQIIELVVGRALDTVFPPKGSVNGPIMGEDLLTVRGLSGSHFHDVSFTVKPGEMVGLAGVQGNGQENLIRALAGVDNARGDFSISGKSVRLGSSSSSAAAGVVYVPSDRHGEGLFMPMSVGENIVMKTLSRVSRSGVISEAETNKVAKAEIVRQAIKTPSQRTSVSSLSGGNQQKVVLARTLLAEPKVLLAEEPTQGVDAGARVDIYKILRKAADDGAAVVILSSDGVELAGLCDRVLIMSRGQVVEELAGEEVSDAGITKAALTSTSLVQREGGERSAGSRFKSWLKGDHSPAAVLGLIILMLAVVVGSINPAYFSAFNIANLLVVASMFILVGAAQQVVVMGSGFDLTVGPLMSFLVVIASYYVIDGGSIIVGLGLMILASGLVGLANGFLVTRFNLSPVVLTLAIALGLQGALFQIRSTPGGLFAPALTEIVLYKLGGWVPLSAVFAIVAVLFLEWALRRTRWGVELRAVGSRKDAAGRLGINTGRVQMLSYLVTTLLVMPAAVILMSQIGVGDGRPGLSFTLSSITVLVLSGAAIFGGRGSFIGILVAGLLVGQLLGIPGFLGASGAWGYLLPGLITVAAAVLYAQVRRTRRN